MEKETINSYLINFRRFFSPYLKKDVSVKNTVFPYSNGAIIIMELDINSSNNTEFMAQSTSLVDAMTKTNLFDNPTEVTPLSETKIITQNNRIIIIKNDNNDLWNEKSALNDVSNFMSSLNGRKNG